ncbi:hypothetical protein [Tunturiibacter gelidiferens]|uniref:hypothetical protein n=1 Tax=Tunturiibacter gelidiferens TaxID=3069689 RepID=UPI003D9B46AC
MSTAVLGLVVMGASVTSLEGQTPQVLLAEPPTPLLPESLRGVVDHDAGTGAPSWSGADGPVLVEDGIRRFERGGPQSPGANGTVTVYQFEDATGRPRRMTICIRARPM